MSSLAKKGRVTYPDMKAALRTHQSFIEHHKMRSIIEDLKIDMVRDIPIDYMHLVCLGVMRKLLLHWVKRRTSHHLISTTDVEEISRRLELIRKYCCKSRINGSSLNEDNCISVRMDNSHNAQTTWG